VVLKATNEGVEAHPVLGKSGAISTLSKAHGYFLIDEDIQGHSIGELVKVFLYQ
jgi:molybdopterin molybdotransferase